MTHETWQARLHRMLGLLLLYEAADTVYAVCCLLMLVRCWPRLAAGILLAHYVCNCLYNPDWMYGFDLLAASALCYSMVPSAGACNRLGLLALRWQLMVVYFFSGWQKWMGKSWHSGQALWKALNLPQFKGVLHGDWVLRLGDWPGLLAGLGLAVVILEVSYPVWCIGPRSRRLTVGFIITLHAGIALVMGLYQFSLLMIALNMVAWLKPHALDTDGVGNGEQCHAHIGKDGLP